MINRTFSGITAFLAAIIILLFAVPFGIKTSAANKYIYDLCGELKQDKYSSARVNALEDTAASLSQKTGMSVAVVITDDIGTKSSMTYADDFYDNTFGPNTNGLILLVNLDTGYDYISTSGKAIDYFTSSRIDKIFDALEKDMKSYNVLAETEKYFQQVERYYDSGKPGEGLEPDEKSAIVITVGVASLIAVIITGVSILIVYKKHKKTSSITYVSRRDVNFVESADDYIRTYTTKVRIQSSNGGGGTHFSSGGGFHGGGGRGR